MKVVSKRQSDFMPDTDIWHVYSEAADAAYRVCVTSPSAHIGAKTDAGRYAALYGLDGDHSAGLHASVARQMAIAGEIPPMFAVSIGYPLDAPAASVLTRNRDLSPTSVPTFDEWNSRIWGAQTVIASGGAPRFLEFLRDELKPALEAEYPLDPSEATLSGVSLGGLFVAFALTAAPTTFRRYNIVSPALWWDGAWAIREAESFVAHSSNAELDIYLSAGEMEHRRYHENWLRQLPAPSQAVMRGFMEMAGWPDMISDCLKLGEILGRLPKSRVRVTTHILDAETHQTVYTAGLSQALRTLHRTIDLQKSWLT